MVNSLSVLRVYNFQKKILAYKRYFKTFELTNDVISFEQPGPVIQIVFQQLLQ